MNTTMKTASRIKSGSLGKKILLLCFLLLMGLFFSTCAEAAVSPEPNPTPEPKLDIDPDDPATHFVSKWIVPPGGSIELPLVNGGNYDFTVDWGDDTPEVAIKAWDAPEATHVYSNTADKEYVVTINKGTFNGLRFVDDPDAASPNFGDAAKLTDITQWGNMKLGDTIDSHFMGASNLVGFTASDMPDLSGKTSLKNAFRGASKFNGDLSAWDVSGVMNMDNMFRDATAFNQDIKDWDVSSVTTMEGMFYGTTAFNNDGNPLSWDASLNKVENMASMFRGAAAFNQDISGWDVSAVTSMKEMFMDTSAFNQDISAWDVSNVINMGDMFFKTTAFNNGGNPLNWDAKLNKVMDMENMFREAVAFNQDISNWDVSNVITMEGMFYGTTAFNNGGNPLTWDAKLNKVENMASMFQGAVAFNVDISNWDVSAVTNMAVMFSGASMFNQPLNAWGDKTQNVENMSSMFSNTTLFNQHLDLWNVGSVTNMSGMFQNARAFNGRLENWERPTANPPSTTGNVKNMFFMFSEAHAFNQPLNKWNVSMVTNMQGMFRTASRGNSNFNQPLNMWNVGEVTTMHDMFNGAGRFNQNLSSWNVTKVISYNYFSVNSGLSSAHRPAFQ